MIFSTARTKFLEHCSRARRLSQHTVKAYLYDLADAELYFGRKTKPSAIDHRKLNDYLDHLRRNNELKEATIKRRFACLRVFFRWLCSTNALRLNPFDDADYSIRLPQRLPRALERSERLALLKVAKQTTAGNVISDEQYRTAIHMLLETGLRISELLALECCDLSLNDQSLLVLGKGNRQRRVFIASGLLIKRLRHYLIKRQAILTPSKQLFVDSTGIPLSATSVRRELVRFAADARIKKHVTPHMLRHTCATHWLESGVDIRYVQRLLGHQSISTTEIYTHVSDVGIREALTRAFQR